MANIRSRPIASACATAAFAMVSLAGCVEVDNNATPAATSTESSANPTTAATSSEGPPPTAPPTRTTTAAPPTTQPTTPAVAACQAGQLSVDLGAPDGAAGSTTYALTFTNTSGESCRLDGFPGVSYVTGSGGTQVGAAAERSGGSQGATTLSPGNSASAQVQAVQVANYPESDCNPEPVAGLRVYPPGSYDALFVALDGTGCANDGVKQLSVTAIG